MSSDPKKPAFDAPPSNTPDLLQKDMSLDRRKRVPSFEELQGGERYDDLPTEPARPVVARPAAIPQVTVSARPSRDEGGTHSAPTIPIPPGMLIRQAAPPAQAPRAATPAAPLQPPRAGAPTAPLAQAPRPATPAAGPPAPRTATPAAQLQAPRAAAPAAPAAPAPRTATPAAPLQAPRAAAPSAPAPQAPRTTAPAASAPQAPRTAAPLQAPRAAAPSSPAPQAPRTAAPAAPAPQAPRTDTPTVPARPPVPPAAARPASAEAPPRTIAEAEAWNAQQQATRVAAAPVQDQVTRASAPHRPPGAREEPPSPVEFAQSRPAAVPQVTPSVPSQGAVVPEGQPANPERAQPAFRPAAPRPEPVLHDEPEPRTIPAGPSARSFTPQPAPAKPLALPAEMLVTQPGLPGPFAARELAQPLSIPDLPAAPAPSELNPALVEPQFDEQQPMDDTVTAEPAALWRRSFAWLADLTFVGCLVLGFLAVAVAVIAPKNLTPAQQLAAIAVPAAGLAAILAFVYTTLFAFLWSGRTPGRRMMGIHLVDVTGHAPGPARALVRAMLSLVSFGLFLSGFWLALFDRHGQTLHDKLTRTFVVKLQDA